MFLTLDLSFVVLINNLLILMVTWTITDPHESGYGQNMVTPSWGLLVERVWGNCRPKVKPRRLPYLRTHYSPSPIFSELPGSEDQGRRNDCTWTLTNVPRSPSSSPSSSSRTHETLPTGDESRLVTPEDVQDQRLSVMKGENRRRSGRLSYHRIKRPNPRKDKIY